MLKNISALLLFCCLVFLSPKVCFAEAAETSAIQLSGLIESEVGILIVQGDEITTESYLALSTVEFSADAQLSDNVLAHLLLLYEEGENDDNLAVDEGSITLRDIYGTPLAITAGRMYLPFGEFNSHFVVDPFTLEMAETNKTALQLGFEREPLSASLALFKSGVVVAGEQRNHINNIAVRIAAIVSEERLREGISLSAGASVIKNLADTDGVGDITGVDLAADKLEEIPLGLGIFTSVGLLGAFLEGEFITALGDFSGETGCPNCSAGVAFKSKPWAFNGEIGYTLANLPIPLEVAAKFERLYQGEDANVNRFGGVINASLFSETAGIAAEFLRADAGDASDPENTLTFLLSVEF